MALQELKNEARARNRDAFVRADDEFREDLASELERLAGVVRRLPRPACEVINDKIQCVKRMVDGR